MTIREEVGKILGIYIAPGKIENEFQILDRVGGITNKKLIKIIVTILNYLEKYDEKRSGGSV